MAIFYKNGILNSKKPHGNKFFLLFLYLFKILKSERISVKRRKGLEYYCDCCSRRLHPTETVKYSDEVYGELYISCGYCAGECTVRADEKDSEGEENNDGYTKIPKQLRQAVR